LEEGSRMDPGGLRSDFLYLFILGRVSIPAKLDPPAMFFLWPCVVAPLTVFMIIDIVLLRK